MSRPNRKATATAADEAKYEAANDGGLQALLSTAPQTRAGTRALIGYVQRFDIGA
jgi:hypothetical protein